MTGPIPPLQSGTSAATRAMRASVIVTPGTPLLFDTVRASGPDGIRFDVWYCNRHVPALTRAAGVGRLRRYAAPALASYLVLAELATESGMLASLPVPDPAPTTVVHTERFVGQPLGTQRREDCPEEILESAIAYPVYFNVPDSREAEFNRWYTEEHLPMLLACREWVMCRRFRVTQSPMLNWTHVALHYLTDLRALQSPERDAARSTPWRRQLEAEEWFKPEYRIFYGIKYTSPEPT